MYVDKYVSVYECRWKFGQVYGYIRICAYLWEPMAGGAIDFESKHP